MNGIIGTVFGKKLRALGGECEARGEYVNSIMGICYEDKDIGR